MPPLGKPSAAVGNQPVGSTPFGSGKVSRMSATRIVLLPAFAMYSSLLSAFRPSAEGKDPRGEPA